MLYCYRKSITSLSLEVVASLFFHDSVQMGSLSIVLCFAYLIIICNVGKYEMLLQ